MFRLNNEIILVINVYLDSTGNVPEEVYETIKYAEYAVKSSQFATVKCFYIIDQRQKNQILKLITLKEQPSSKFIFLRHSQKLPMIGDILRSAGKHAPENSYLCYINADILLPYWFFDFIAAEIRTHPQNSGIIINRKDVLNIEQDFERSEIRVPIRYHPGFDCFVFPRKTLQSCHFGRCTVGLPPVGALVVTNMLANLDAVKLINDGVVTIHRGDGRVVSNWHNKKGEIQKNYELAYEAMDKLVKELRDKGVNQIKTLGISALFAQRYLKSRS